MFDDWQFEAHYRGRRLVSMQRTAGTAVIHALQLDDSRFFKEFSLKPNFKYRATVHAAAETISQRDVGANISVLGEWIHSKEFNCGVGSFEGDLSIEFITNDTGKITLAIRLGFYCSEAKGSVVFSAFRIEELSEIITIGDGNVRLSLDLNMIEEENLDLGRIEMWVFGMQIAYEKMLELYGKAPAKVIRVEPRDINAYGLSGNPISWNKRCMINYFKDPNVENACFGTIHELGHDFDQTPLNRINCEMMANFALLYAVENANLYILFDNEMSRGRGLQDGFYRRCYEKTIKVRKYHHDGLTYCLLRIKDKITWEPFRKVMRKLMGVNCDKMRPTEILNLWLKMLSDESKYDVRLTFPDGELQFLLSQNQL